MIQDIAPHRYDNTYHIQKPGAQDYVFCIQKGRILLRETAEEHVLTIPRREEIEAAVPELLDRAVYLFSVDEKPYFLVSVPEKEAEEILAKLKEGAGQMPVSDKNNMEAGKTDSGTLEGAEKELEQLYYAWKTPTDIRAMEPMHQAFAAITAVQLWRWSRCTWLLPRPRRYSCGAGDRAVSSAGAVGQRRRTARSSGRSSARSAARRNIQRSPRQSSWRSRTGTNFLCRATASTTVLTVDMR